MHFMYHRLANKLSNLSCNMSYIIHLQYPLLLHFRLSYIPSFTTQHQPKYMFQCYIVAIKTVMCQGVHIPFTCKVKTPLLCTTTPNGHEICSHQRHTHSHNTHTCQITNQLDIIVVGSISDTHHYPQVTVRGLPHNTSINAAPYYR